MKKISLILSLLLIITSGCQMPVESVNKAAEFFPLKVGNKWYYNSDNADPTTFNEIWEVTGKKILDDKEYFEVIKTFIPRNHKDTVYYRFEGAALFRKYSAYKEEILADFSLEIDQQAYWRKDLKVTTKNEDLVTFKTPFYADYGFSITFKRNTGILSLIQNGFIYYSLKLIKAEIK